MKTQRNKLNFKGETIYAGIDVHKKSWKVTTRSSNMELKTFTQPPDPGVLNRYLKREFPGATYTCCYESGFSGFWIYDELEAMGIQCKVAHPADVPTTDKERQKKEDKRDSRKLARTLENGGIEGIYVHDLAQREERSLVRCWKTMGWDLTAYKNRIKSLLAFYGTKYPEVFTRATTHWSNRFIQWLDSLTMETEPGTFCLKNHLEQMKHTRKTQSQVIRQLRQLSKSEKYKERVTWVESIPGIGVLSAMLFLTEVGDIRRFRNLDVLCSYVGLVPNTYSSGEHEYVGGMTHRGNSWLKDMLIECSWVSVRNDSALLLKYKELCKHMDSNNAIIYIARKLLNRIRFVLLNGKKYEIRKVK